MLSYNLVSRGVSVKLGFPAAGPYWNLESLWGTAAMETTERRVGRYLLLEPLGRGAMGTVYRAEDPFIRRTVAVKLLHTDGEAHPSG